MKSLATKTWSESRCCVCGLTSCKQSTDHTFVSLKQFKAAIENGKIMNRQLNELKQRTDEFYKMLKEELISKIEKDHSKIQEHLNRFYYPHINPQKINFSQLCQFANSKFSNLPSKKIIKYMELLAVEKKSIDSIEQNIEFQQVAQDINSYLSEFQKKKELQKFEKHLPFASVIEKALPKLKLRRSQSEISNPEEIDEQAAKTYTWKNVTITSKTKVLQLSNKNITDNQLLKQMGAISSFKHIKDFEIRNNKISSLSCKIIASNMGHVKSIDIRGNPVGDEGVIAIIKGIPHLKSFMISQTNCTNASALAIVNGLPDIQMLWCQQNRVDGQHAILIGELKKLKVLSFAGNGLDSETGDKLKKIFNSKGYVTV